MGIHYGKADFINYGKPSLLLDFARNKSLVDRISGNNLITFTRSSVGTYVDENGLIKYAAADEARFDHNPTTGESLGLLIEESRNNLINYSEDFGNNWWTKYDCSLSQTASAPDGSNNATIVTRDSTSYGTVFIYKPFGISVTTGESYTISWFVKAGTYAGNIRLDLDSSGTGGYPLNVYTVTVNLSTGVRTGGASSGYTITPYPDGWYRITLTGTATTNGSIEYSINTSGPSVGQYFYAWGAQIEAGAFPTSYIPTSGSTVTRQPDNAQITGTNFSSWYNQSEGSILMNFKSNMISSSNSVVLSLDNGSVYPWPIYRFNGATENWWKWYNGNDSIVTIKTGFTNLLYKFGFAFNQTNGSSVESGTLTQTDITSLRASTKYASSNRMSIGYALPGGSYRLVGHINKLVFYPTRLTNTQLQQLTQ
jgi:hypothetical protein